MDNMRPGAISNFKLEKIEVVLAELPAEEAGDIRDLVAKAREIQKTCTHAGWSRGDGIYLECGTCGAHLVKVWGQR